MQRALLHLLPIAALLPLTACSMDTGEEDFASGFPQGEVASESEAQNPGTPSDNWPGTGGTGSTSDDWPDNGRQCETGATDACTTACGTQGTTTCDDNLVWGACEPDAAETICGDGIDNDCDGRIDGSDPDCPGTTETCEETHGNNCNGDLGYGDHCDPSDNTNGCSDEKFWAWCNRRNPTYPDIWEQWIRNWVDSNCDGEVTKSDDQYAVYRCKDSTNITYECTTPLVLAFDGEPVTFAETEHGFSLTTQQGAARTDWPTSATPWLALDRNGNGGIDDGRELFGSATVLSTGAAAGNGFQALADLDDNADGVIDEGDAAWSHLLVWRDANHDGVSSAAELTSLSEEGLRSLSLAYTTAPRCDLRGNCERERSTFAWHDDAGRTRTGAVIDVYLRLQAAVCR